MAVVKGPNLSLDATGPVGKTFVYSHWKGRNVIRKLVKPHNPKSGLQQGMRAGLRFMATSFAALSTTAKANWLAKYKKLAITTLNSYIKFNQPRIRNNLGVVQDPTVAAGAVEAAPTTVAATAATRQVKLTWVDSLGANDTCTFIYRSTTTGFTPAPANLLQIVAHGVQIFTDTKVISGTPYYYVLGGCEKGGTLGTQAAQVTATPT
jgi:hypothetical protein